MNISEGGNLSYQSGFLNIPTEYEGKRQGHIEQEVKIESQEKMNSKEEDRSCEDKAERPEQKNENFENFSNDGSVGRDKSFHSWNATHAAEMAYDANPQGTKGGHQKIFTTTVMEKKKNINFKVIKKKEKEAEASAGFPSIQNYIPHNYEKNNNKNNKNNNYFREAGNNSAEDRQIFQNVILDNFSDKIKSNKGVGYITGFGANNGLRMSQNSIFGQVNTVNSAVNSAINNGFNPSINTFSSINSINSINNFSHSQFLPNNNYSSNFGHSHSMSFIPNHKDSFYSNANLNFTRSFSSNLNKKKSKLSETYYLDVFINAAEKILQTGYTLEEANDSARESSSLTVNETSIKENKDKIFYDSDKVLPMDVEPNLVSSTSSNLNMNNNSLNHSQSCEKIDKNEKFEKNDKNDKNLQISHNKQSNINPAPRNPLSKSSLNGKCGNKNCETHKNRKKIKIFKLRTNRGKVLRLCHNCVEAYNNKQYCYFCLSIYRDSNINSYVDDKGWILCDYCDSWQHIQCEEKKGNYYTNLHKLLDDNNFKYACPHCRNKRQSEKANNQGSNSSSLLKKKRNKTQNQNFYRKEYDFSFKYSNSKRIKEKKMKMIEKMNSQNQTLKTVEKEEMKQSKRSSNANNYDMEVIQIKKRKVLGSKSNSSNLHGFTFMNDNENSREIIQDIHKIQDKLNMIK